MSSFELVHPDTAVLRQETARAGFQEALARWSGGTLLLAPGAADRWWPLTARTGAGR